MGHYVDISLDKARQLRYTINAVRELERHFGRTFGQIFDPQNLGFEEIIMLLTIGLKYGETEKRPLTDTRVGELVQKCWLEQNRDLGELTDLIIEAMQESGILTKKPDDDDNQLNKAVPAGGKKELPNV